MNIKGLFQVIAGSVITLGGIALGVATFVSTGNATAAVTTSGPVIALGVGIAGFSRTVVDSMKAGVAVDKDATAKVQVHA